MEFTNIPEDLASGGFLVDPIDCPHANIILDKYFENYSDALRRLTKTNCQSECAICSDNKENWCCLECGDFYCSRYCKSHMASHYENEKELQLREVTNNGHAIAMSLSDASFWCYECDSYIKSTPLGMLAMAYGKIKFPDLNSLADESTFDELILQMHTRVRDTLYGAFTKELLLEGLAASKFRRVCFLSGAGISVAAG